MFSSLPRLIGAVASFSRICTATPIAEFIGSCSDLINNIHFENATVAFTEYVSAGTNLTFPDLDSSCGAAYQVVDVDLCRVNISIATSSRSVTIMEAWLPRDWTGRFLATGNGGIDGCLSYDDMAYATNLGFATTGSNNGHRNGQNGSDFLNNNDVVTDFAWRSLYISAVIGKNVGESFYGKQQNKSYYLGCSTGGREGFKMAQDFPELFDGIVAGSPAIAFDNLTSWSGVFHGIIDEAGPDGNPPNSSLQALDEALLAQCDKLDGAEDGILEDPSLCNFRPEALICGRDNGCSTTNKTCITGKQAAVIRSIFSDLYGVNGTLVYPRMQPGPGVLASVYQRHGGASQSLYTDQWFKYAVYNNPHLDTSIITPEEMAYAWNLDPGSINTWSGDLSGIAKRGSKILHYHGQQDPVISSTISNLYYNHVERTMNLPSKDLDEFYRFFRISGMGHCGGGPGASNIGNTASGNASLDPDKNVLTAMVRWVEEGIAPDAIVGTAFVNQDKSHGVAFTRAHCKYPLRNVYKGFGDIKDISSWECIV